MFYILFRNIQKFYFLLYNALILSGDIEASGNIESVADVEPPWRKKKVLYFLERTNTKFEYKRKKIHYFLL